jgi:hypothetical protein
MKRTKAESNKFLDSPDAGRISNDNINNSFSGYMFSCVFKWR